MRATTRATVRTTRRAPARTAGGGRTARPVAVALAALLPVLAGCGYATAAPDQVVMTPDFAKQCGGPLPAGVGEAGYPTPDGGYLFALTVGRSDAPHRVVVVHGRTQTACDWLQIARTVADRADAYLVLPDRRGVGQNSAAPTGAASQSSDVVVAAGVAADTERRPVTVVGSSAGAPVAFEAAVLLTSGAPAPVCSVALVSPASMPDVDPDRARGLTVPLFLTWEGGNDGIAAVAQRIRALAPAASAAGASVAVPGTKDHSSGLVEKHPEALDVLVDAVRACG